MMMPANSPASITGTWFTSSRLMMISTSTPGVAGDRVAVAPHQIGRADPLPLRSDRRLRVAGARRVHQEPPDEGEPEPAGVGPAEEAEESEHDEPARHGLADARRAPRGALGIVDRPEHPPAVERIAGDQVEHGEDEVDRAEPAGRGGDRTRRAPFQAPAQAPRDGDAADPDRDARDRSRRGHPELDPRRRRLALDAGDAAEREQRDGPDLQSVRPPQQGVRELVGQQGHEEEQRRDDRGRPDHRQGPGRTGRAKMRRQRGGDERGVISQL